MFNKYELNADMNKTIRIYIKYVNMTKNYGLFQKVNKNVYVLKLNKSNTLYKTIEALYHEFTHVVDSIVISNGNTYVASAKSVPKGHDNEYLPETISKFALKQFKKRLVKI